MISSLSGTLPAVQRQSLTSRMSFDPPPVKMLFPLVLLILPAFLLLTVVPVLVTTVSSIR